MKQIIFLILIGSIIQSCCKADCINGALSVSFENFKAVDTDTVLLVRYNQGQQTALDTSIRTTVAANDTIKSYMVEQVYYNNDWRIIIPALNKNYQITNLAVTTIKCCGEKSKRVKTYKINNVQKEGDFLLLE